MNTPAAMGENAAAIAGKYNCIALVSNTDNYLRTRSFLAGVYQVIDTLCIYTAAIRGGVLKHCCGCLSAVPKMNVV